MNEVKNGGLFRGPFFCGLTAIFLLLTTSPLIQAEELYIDAFQPAAHYAHTERENVRVYEGNSYQGLQYRGRRVYLQRSAGSANSASATTTGTADSAGALYRGSVYLIKTLTRDALQVLQPVDREIPIICRVSANGFTPVEGSELPIRTGFPVIPEGDIAPGDSWKADGRDSVYLEDGTLIPAPFHSSFTYRGEMEYMDRPAHVIDFSYTHYDHSPYTNDSTEIRGRATGEIALFLDENDKGDGADKGGGYFISERITRHYLEYGTPARREEGFRLTWGRGVSLGEIESLERTMIAALQEEQEDQKEQGDQGVAKKAEGEPGRDKEDGPVASAPEGAADGAVDEAVEKDEEDQQIQIKRSTEGITLNLPRIHFYPDQARILPREKNRLDKLAALLKKVPDATIMVKGHTADVGSKESQYKLSVERAQTIIEQMVDRGLAPSRFVYQGVGGDEPLAPNDTEEGRAQNRRVEVIILNK